MGKVRVRPAGPDDIDAVCELLHAKMNTRIGPHRWRRLMEHPWVERAPDLGRVADHDGRVVGFVGMVYSDRFIADKWERVVNICAWYLDKPYRRQGVGIELMRSATADPVMSYHILTSSSRALSILEAVGYQVMDSERFFWRAQPGGGEAVSVEADAVVIRNRADSNQRRILDDHASLPVRAYLLNTASAPSLALFSVVRKGDHQQYFDLLHLDNPGAFAANAQAVADRIATEPGTIVAADCRFFHGHRVDAERFRIDVPRFYKSNRLKPWQLDNLYSEVQLMDLKLD